LKLDQESLSKMLVTDGNVGVRNIEIMNKLLSKKI